MGMQIKYKTTSSPKTQTIKTNTESIIESIAEDMGLTAKDIFVTCNGRPISNTIESDSTYLASLRLFGGRALNENDKELVKTRNEIQVCYKCNGRLKLTMTHCRKKRC